jgi:hypothetical protein
MKHVLEFILLSTVIACSTVSMAATENAPVDDFARVHETVAISRLDAAPDMEEFAHAMEAGVDPAPGMARVDSLVSRTPVDGVPASQRTVVYLGYDEANIHAVFLSFDDEPGLIRSSHGARDQLADDDDSVALHLGPVANAQHLYGFQTNLHGTRLDAAYHEGQGWDLTFDTQWSSTGRRTSNGYVVMISVPFNSLRYPPEAVQDWNFFVFRGIPRGNEESFYPAYSTRISGRTVQAGVLEGIEPSRAKLYGHISPFVSFRGETVRDTSVEPYGQWEDENAEEIGLDGKLVWQNRLVLDFTINPDFSQIESDEPQLLANERFEVFFPEKRPFFLENAGYFHTPINLLFTRRIVAPDGGVKLTGQIDDWSVAGLIVDDSLPGDSITPGDDANITAGAVQRRVGNDSSIGVMAVYRDGPLDTVGNMSVDSRVRLSENWTTALQLAGSHAQSSAGSEDWNKAWHAALDGGGESWTYGLVLQDVPATFLAPVGFVPRSGVRTADQLFSYRFRPAESVLLSYGPDIELGRAWSEDGIRLDDLAVLRFNVELPRQTSVSIERQWKDERLLPTDFPSLSTSENFSQGLTRLAFSSAWNSQTIVGLAVSTGDAINYAPAPGASPRTGTYRSEELTLRFRAGPRLVIDGAWLASRLTNEHHTRIFRSDIGRIKVAWQMTDNWGLRLITDYGRNLPNPTQSALEHHRNLVADVMLHWQPHSGRELFAGVTHNWLDVTGADELPANGRIVFLKYTHRFDF